MICEKNQFIGGNNNNLNNGLDCTKYSGIWSKTGTYSAMFIILTSAMHLQMNTRMEKFKLNQTYWNHSQFSKSKTFILIVVTFKLNNLNENDYVL